MAERIKMPQLGESVAEGTIGKWLKRPGDRVERDELLVEVITDKVNAEIPSPFAGILEEILAAEGETVPVDAEIAVIGDGSGVKQSPAELGAEAGAATASVEEPAASESFDFPGRAAPLAPAASATPEPPALLDASGQDGPRFYTPVVMRMARENGIDLTQVAGSGLGGRVTKRDLET